MSFEYAELRNLLVDGKARHQGQCKEDEPILSVNEQTQDNRNGQGMEKSPG